MRTGAAAAALHFRVVRPVRGLKVEARGATSGKIYGRRIFARAVPSEMQKIVLRDPVEEDIEVAESRMTA